VTVTVVTVLRYSQVTVPVVTVLSVPWLILVMYRELYPSRTLIQIALESDLEDSSSFPSSLPTDAGAAVTV
jgi:hypothetical protein